MACASISATTPARPRSRRADGSYATVIDRGFVIRDVDSRPARRVGGLSDISERMAIEEHLRQTQRLESIGQLTGGIAHDFNNLLTVILGNSELMAELLADRPDVLPIAEMVREAAQRGADLTGRLLAFARRQALEPQAVDVVRLIENFRGLLERTLGERIEIRIFADVDHRLAFVDPTQLESALLNLAINARDAMPDGGKLTIATAVALLAASGSDRLRELGPGRYLTMTVTDTGSGMAPEVAERAFEPFFTTKAPGKGTGLGLSMVYGFARQSRGLAEIQSQQGLGTVVRLYLPAAQAGIEIETEEAPVLDDPGAGTVLLVEDDDMVRVFAATQLRSLGYRVVEASDGRQALSLLETGAPIDLLFTDIVMPGDLGGRALAEAARALRPGLPILFTSGYTDGKLANADGGHPLGPLLSKPYRRAELAQRIGEALNPRKT
jgi:signal transduction histidine kinase/CheY-like chemotaxis protein